MLDLPSVLPHFLLDSLTQEVALKFRECTGSICPQLLVLEYFSCATRPFDHHADTGRHVC